MAFLDRLNELCEEDCDNGCVGADDAARLAGVVDLVKCKIISCNPEFSDIVPELDRLLTVLEGCSEETSNCEDWTNSGGYTISQIQSVLEAVEQGSGLVNSNAVAETTGMSEASANTILTLLASKGKVEIGGENNWYWVFITSEGVC